jgi:hypothetical protein
MAVHPPGFSERVFEFSFNAEFCQNNKAILAAAPDIPTQHKEKWLGYDVAFELKKRGGAIHSVALQHKVARFVDGLGPSNHHFWHAIGGPYLAFPIDTDQFNLISIASTAGLPGVEIHYCAPLFTTLDQMNNHYLASAVSANAVWIDISAVGEIGDMDRHTMVMSPNGAIAYLCSDDPRVVKTLRPDEHQRPTDPILISLENMRQAYDVAYSALEEYWPRRSKRRQGEEVERFRLPDQLPPKQPLPNLAAAVDTTGLLLSEYYGLTWLIEAAK